MSDKLKEAQKFIAEWGYCSDNYMACNIKQFLNSNNDPDDNSVQLHEEHEEMLRIVVKAGLGLTLKEIRATNDAKKDFRNRALLVIETLCSIEIVCQDIEKLKSDIYMIAHSAITPKTCKHEDWREKTEKMFKSFEKTGLL